MGDWRGNSGAVASPRQCQKDIFQRRTVSIMAMTFSGGVPAWML
jgi:hypothetical protein